MTLAGIIIIILVYANDIVLMVSCPSDLDKQFRILKDLCSSMGMIILTKKQRLL